VSDTSGRPTVGFLLEQTLGHVTHSDNLINLVPSDDRIAPRFVPIPYDFDGWVSQVPGYSNWTVRAGIRARRAIRALDKSEELSALFIHTQVLSILAGNWMSRVPSVISIDATPIQYDRFGDVYAHERSGERVESVKRWLNQRAFAKSAAMISWSAWSKQSLVDDYGVPASKVTVLAPGVDIAKWAPQVTRTRGFDTPMQVLFVGGDLKRKGGSVLIEAVRRMRQSASNDATVAGIELHLVTGADIENESGIVVHRGLRPNSAALIERYHQADVFCLPTLGDCLPMVLSEAGAAGLPLVSTAVGAIPEIVGDGRTGLIVDVDNVDSLVSALTRLASDERLRRQLGANAAAVVADRFDAAKNAHGIVDVLIDAVAQHRHVMSRFR
jgi:glycosyltransferase involved in cell wall biosynthesis